MGNGALYTADFSRLILDFIQAEGFYQTDPGSPLCHLRPGLFIGDFTSFRHRPAGILSGAYHFSKAGIFIHYRTGNMVFQLCMHSICVGSTGFLFQ